MTNAALDKILADIYVSLRNDNEGLDAHIATLKTILQAEKTNAVEVDPTQLVQPNRQGRKIMQSYFKKRGVIVNFAETKVSGAA